MDPRETGLGLLARHAGNIGAGVLVPGHLCWMGTDRARVHYTFAHMSSPGLCEGSVWALFVEALRHPTARRSWSGSQQSSLTPKPMLFPCALPQWSLQEAVQL